MESVSIESNGEHAPAERPLLFVGGDTHGLARVVVELASVGYSVTVADNGAVALELLKQRHFPVVVTDYLMPMMDGLQLIARVREQEADRNYFIVWSVCQTSEDRDRIIARGADDHVQKQFLNATLIERIEAGFEVMAQRECARQLQMMRTCGDVLGRDRDTDAWNSVANRLHSQMVHAARTSTPLAAVVLHVERQLAPREKPLLTLKQFNHLVKAINSVRRLNVDSVLPLDAGDGLARVLLVLPATGMKEAQAKSARLKAALAQSTYQAGEKPNIEDTAALPDCAMGVAAIETWETATVTNAGELVAAAERSMESLALPVD